MNQHKEVVSALISLVTFQYNSFVELLTALTMMLAQKRLIRKSFLLLMMNSDSKMQNGNKGNKHSPPRFWVRPNRNVKKCNDFLNGYMIPEKGKPFVNTS